MPAIPPTASAGQQSSTRETYLNQGKEQPVSHGSSLARTNARNQPQCKTAGDTHITITCRYKAIHASANQGGPHIALNRFVVSFSTNDESLMRVDLTFTNEDTKPILEARTIYLAIDDAANHNYLRRILPQVDFRNLAPDKPRTYSDRLLAGSFRPGDYTFHLWIPSPEPSRKFSSADNFLLSSAGVPNPATGLNTLAEFTVRR
ncbi:MAG TPA: hypothetical protein VNE63_06065 [Candidatus Acidoferrales bacterium]|nr:hypothetical protein [Candidatus Acidoferrales bacterium]